MDKRESGIFVVIVGFIIQIVIQLFFTTKLIVFEIKTGILCNNFCSIIITAIRMKSSSRDIYFHTLSRSQTKL